MNLRGLRVKHAALACSVMLGVLTLGACGQTAPQPNAAANDTVAAAERAANNAAQDAARNAANNAVNNATDSGGTRGDAPTAVNAGSGGQAALDDGSPDLGLALGIGGLAVAATAGGLLSRRRRAE